MAVAIDKADAGTAGNDAAGTSIAVNTTQTVASGGFIVVTVGWYHASATLSSVSGGGLSWSIAVQGRRNLDNPQVGLAYAQAPSGLASSTTITANFSASVNARAIGVTSYTGVATSSPLGATAGAQTGGTTAWTTGNVTVAAGSVLVGTSHLDTTGTSTATSPSLEALDFGDGANFRNTTAYRIESGAGSVPVAGTWSTTSGHVTVAAEFKVAASGTNQTVTAVIAQGLGSAPIATVSGSGSASLVAVAATGLGSAPAAALSAGSTIGAVAATALGSAPPANQILSVVITAPAVIALGSAPAPLVDSGGVGGGISAIPATGLGNAPVAAISSGSTITAVRALALGSAPIATIAQGAGISAVPAFAVGQAPRPAISPAPAGGTGNPGDVAATFAEASG